MVASSALYYFFLPLSMRNANTLMAIGIISGLCFSSPVAAATSTRKSATTVQQPRAVLQSSTKLCLDYSRTATTRSTRNTAPRYKTCDKAQTLKNVKFEQEKARAQLRARLMTTSKMSTRAVQENHRLQVEARAAAQN